MGIAGALDLRLAGVLAIGIAAVELAAAGRALRGSVPGVVLVLAAVATAVCGGVMLPAPTPPAVAVVAGCAQARRRAGTLRSRRQRPI